LEPSRLPLATGKVRKRQAAGGPYPPPWFSGALVFQVPWFFKCLGFSSAIFFQVPWLCRQTITIPQRCFPIHAPIATANDSRDDSTRRRQKKGWAMNEQEDRLARAREEIAARVASFKATQEKFEREREEYYATTLGNAWSGFNRPSFWN
jgi:hypothetical protein